MAALARARPWRRPVADWPASGGHRRPTGGPAAAGSPAGQQPLAGHRRLQPADDKGGAGGLAAAGSPARLTGVSEPNATAARTAVAAVISVIDVAAVTVAIVAAIGPPWPPCRRNHRDRRDRRNPSGRRMIGTRIRSYLCDRSDYRAYRGSSDRRYRYARGARLA